MRTTRNTAPTVTTSRRRWTSQRRTLGDTAHPGTSIVDPADLRGVLRQHPAGEIRRVHAEVLQPARLHVDMQLTLDVDSEVDLGRDRRQRRDRDRELPGSQEQVVAVATH